MIRQSMSVVSWTVAAAGLLVFLFFVVQTMQRVGPFSLNRLQDLALGVVLGGMLVVAGGVLQMLVSIDARLENMEGR